MKIIDEKEAWIHTHFFVDSALVTAAGTEAYFNAR